MNNKKTIFLTLGVVVLGVFIFYFLKSQFLPVTLEGIDHNIILFVGEGCPHCAQVEEFIKDNNLKTKINFDTKEVYYNKENSKILMLIAKQKCGFSGDKIGIPFLWTGTNCIVGDEPIINYFKEKAGIH